MKKAWVNCIKKTVSRTLAAILTATSVLAYPAIPTYAQTYGKNGMVREMSSQDLVYDMGLGYNLGNTFDSIGSFIGETDPWNYQKGWGNEVLTKHFIHKVKEGGFKTIRFPVSWAQWIDSDNQVDTGYMDVIQQVVDWVMEEDMYCILNVHHDGGYADTSWIHNAVTDYDGTLKKYTSLWSQIAAKFQGYGDHLIFESMNEIEFPGAGMSRQYEILNSFNQAFVDTVRASGGTNEQRHLLIAGYNTDIKKTCDKRYMMPNDPTGRCILSIHYYSPSPFCVATHDVDWCTPDTDWGTDEDIAQVYADLDLLAERFLSKGTPIIIGEYGVLTEDNKDVESVRKYLRTVPEIILQYGMCPTLWDVSNAGDMKTVERTTGEFYDPVVKANYQQLSSMISSGQIERKVFAYPDYKEVKVPVSPDGWVSLASFEPSKIAGIRFSLKCSSSWDSYGGGGIYLDSWDNTIQYQFNSPYEEVTHMFTEEERARIKDQISVAIWWTDESQGGNHRNELSIANSQVTLLYEENTSVGVVGTRTSSGGGGGASGGGGGGSSHSGGTSNRPNYSTEPGGTTTNPGPNQYSYVLKASRNGAAEGDDRTGVYYLDLESICPDYREGDEVQITITPYSDGGYSYALVDTSAGYGDASESFGTAGTWTVTPGAISAERKEAGYGQIGLYLWYLEKSYFLFNADVVITKKAPEFERITVADGETREFDIRQYLDAGLWENGQRVRLTITSEAAQARTFQTRAARSSESIHARAAGEYSGKVQFTDAKSGAMISGEISNNVPTTVVTGWIPNGDVELVMESGSAVITGIHAEILSREEPMAELAGKANMAQFSQELLKNTETVEDTQDGVKLYYRYEGSDIRDTGTFSASLIINGGTWINNDAWILEEDADGTYIRYNGSVSSVGMASWYLGEGSIVLKKIVLVKAAEKEDPFVITKGECAVKSVQELLEQAGVEAGQRVKMTVTVDGAAGYSGSVSFTEENGNQVTGYFSKSQQDINDNKGTSGQTVLIGTVKEGTDVTFAVDEASAANSVDITGITLEVNEGTALAELPTYQGTKIVLSKQVMDSEFAKDGAVTEGETAGLKVYYTGVADKNWSTGFLSINDKTDWEAMSDEKGNYLWIADSSIQEDALPQTLTIYDSHWDDLSFCVTGVAAVTGATATDDSKAVLKGATKEFALEDALKNVSSSGRVKITVTVAGDNKYDASFTLTDANETKIIASLYSENGGTASASAIGTVGSDDTISISVDESNSAADSITVTSIEAVAVEGEALAEICSTGRIEFNTGLINDESTGDGDKIIRVYYEDLGAGAPSQLAGWDYGDNTWKQVDSGSWISGSDENGTYVGFVTTGQLSSLQAPFYYIAGGSTTFTNLKLIDQDVSAASLLSLRIEQPDEAAQEIVELEAEEIADSIFRLPAWNAPIGMIYTLQSSGETTKSGKADVRMATSSNWEELEEDDHMASPSNWEKVVSDLPTEEDEEFEFWFTPKQIEAIFDKIREAESENEYPVIYIEVSELGFYVEKLYFLYDPEEILDEGFSGSGNDLEEETD